MTTASTNFLSHSLCPLTHSHTARYNPLDSKRYAVSSRRSRHVKKEMIFTYRVLYCTDPGQVVLYSMEYGGEGEDEFFNPA